MTLSVVIAVLCIAAGGVAAQWLAWRFRLPAIVLLFAIGLAVGPGLGLIHPSLQFGPSLQPLIRLAVAIVVFEGGLALDFRELRAAGEGVVRLTAIALPLNFVFGTVAAALLGGLSWPAAALFGAITVVTGPTVVLPLLRHTRLERRAASFLKWEAIVNDPIGAVLASLVLETLLALASARATGTALGMIALRLVLGLVVAAALGIGAGFLVRWTFTRDQMPETLKTPLLVALALTVYALAGMTLDGAGLGAATIFGVTLANLRIPGLSELKRFKEALVVLIVSALFIVLTADLDRSVITQLSWPILALTAAMLLVTRPAAILLATLRSGLTAQERGLAAWIAPRGIVAAAIAGVVSFQLQSAGYPGAERVMPAVFLLIAATVVLHGFSLRPLARALGLTLGNAPGVLIVGASAWTTDLAACLKGLGVPVLLADVFPGALAAARRRRLPVLQAEILSEHGDEKMADWAMDYLIAATPDDIYNGMVCARLAPELGRQRVFQLPATDDTLHQRRGVSREWRGRLFGAADLDSNGFEARYEAGWRFHAFDSPAGAPEQAPEHLPLILLHANQRLSFVAGDGEAPAVAAAGDKTIAFAAPERLPARQAAPTAPKAPPRSRKRGAKNPGKSRKKRPSAFSA